MAPQKVSETGAYEANGGNGAWHASDGRKGSLWMTTFLSRCSSLLDPCQSPRISVGDTSVRGIDPERCRQRNQMILLFNQNTAQAFSDRKLVKQIRLPDATP